MKNPINPLHIAAFVADMLLVIVLVSLLWPQQKKVFTQPQRILFQLTDGQVKAFQGRLIETRDCWRIESDAQTQFRVDSTGATVENNIPAQVVILPKANVNLVNYRTRQK